MDSEKKPLLVEICMGVNCTFRGAGNLLQTIRSEKELAPYCTVREMSCFNDRCEHAYKSPIVRIDGEYYENASPEVILDTLYTRIDEIERVEP